MFRLLNKIFFISVFLLTFVPSSQAMVDDQSPLAFERAKEKLQDCAQEAKSKSYGIARKIIQLVGLNEESRLADSCVASPFYHAYCTAQDRGYTFLVLQYFFSREYQVNEILKPDFVLPKIKVQISAKKFSKEFLNQKGIEVELDVLNSEVFLVTNAEELL